MPAFIFFSHIATAYSKWRCRSAAFCATIRSLSFWNSSILASSAFSSARIAASRARFFSKSIAKIFSCRWRSFALRSLARAWSAACSCFTRSCSARSAAAACSASSRFAIARALTFSAHRARSSSLRRRAASCLASSSASPFPSARRNFSTSSLSSSASSRLRSNLAARSRSTSAFLRAFSWAFAHCLRSASSSASKTCFVASDPRDQPDARLPRTASSSACPCKSLAACPGALVCVGAGDLA
mmetsp:Transcript_42921/g.97080  ORF Transcript_42921/g.97080 Transcript_42921/m.97080 type:complete len:243 (-) Transcript_42921:527-1255(-)